MKKTEINIQNAAIVKAKGAHTHPNSRPIICIETGEVFCSIIDAAEHAGVSRSGISVHLSGKTKSIKGKHYCHLTRLTENSDAILRRLREVVSLEDDANKWRAQEAEKERIRAEEAAKAEAERKAQAAHAAQVAKLERKIRRYNTLASNYEASVNRANEISRTLKDEYFALTGKHYEANEE